MKCFYQDFLFHDVPLKSNDMPSVDLDVIHADDIPLPLEGPFPVEESLSLPFSRLLQVISEEEWNSVMKECEQYHIVYLKDDVLIVNEEIFPFKEMYIKVYYWHISNRCHNTRLVIC